MNESPRVLGNRYEVGEMLGRGGMAEVHLGRDSRLGRTVAIKMLRNDLARDPTFQARFRREAQSAAGLNHPAIVAVYDTGEDQVPEAGGGTLALPYIVMEYVEGRTLREMLNDGQPLATNVALEVTSGVLSALEYSHRAGIVHRDIKPANVMVTKRGEIKVMDFGIARAVADVSATMTQTHAVIGTAQYLSPEQARGETVDARSDLYSAGCMLYELLTGRPPFVADSPVAVAYQHVREMPQPPSTFNPRVPEAVDRVVLHALAKDREARYQSAPAFRADVDAARTGGRVSAAVMSTADPGATAATEYYPQAVAGTRAMAPVPGGMHAGPPTTQQRRPGQQPGDYPYPTRASARNAEPPRANRKNGILVAALLIAFALISYAVYQTVTSNSSGTTKQVTVPNVVNLTQQEAFDSLTGEGLKHTVTAQASDTVAKGRVMSQDPSKDTSVDPGSTVTLVVSTGPSSVEVPDVTGKSQADAREALKNEGLELGDVVMVQSSSYSSGQVVRTEPKAGATAAPGDDVKLYISNGMVKVPDLVGRTEEEAKAELDKLGLSYNREEENSDKEAGIVIAQDPRDTMVEQNTRITITVSTGPAAPSTNPTGTESLDPRESNGWPVHTGPSIPGLPTGDGNEDS